MFNDLYGVGPYRKNWLQELGPEFMQALLRAEETPPNVEQQIRNRLPQARQERRDAYLDDEFDEFPEGVGAKPSAEPTAEPEQTPEKEQQVPQRGREKKKSQKPGRDALQRRIGRRVASSEDLQYSPDMGVPHQFGGF